MVAKIAQFFNQTSTTALCHHLFPSLNEQFMLQLLLKTAYVCLRAGLNEFPYALGLEKTKHFVVFCTVISVKNTQSHFPCYKSLTWKECSSVKKLWQLLVSTSKIFQQTKSPQRFTDVLFAEMPAWVFAGKKYIFHVEGFFIKGSFACLR